MVCLATAFLLGGHTSPTAAAPPDSVSVAISGAQGATAALEGVLSGGVTWVPLRPLAEALGFKVEWVDSEKKVALMNPLTTITVRVGDFAARVGDHTMRLASAPKIVDDRTVVPLRSFAECLGMGVRWDPVGKSVSLRRPVPNPELTIQTAHDTALTDYLSLDIQYPVFSGLAPEMAASWNAFFASWDSKAREAAEQAASELARAALSQWKAQSVADYRVTYNEKGLLSLYLDNYLFAGGAHGNTIRTGYTANVATGQVYALRDLFKEGTDYQTVLSAEVAKQIAERGLTPRLLRPFLSIAPDEGFYIQDGRLVIYFDQYEYFPYAWGFQEFAIPLNSLVDTLEPGLAGVEWEETPQVMIEIPESSFVQTAVGTPAPAVDREVSVDRGQTIKLVLGSNPTTGFSWESPVISDQAVASLVSQAYEPDQSKNGLAGAGGVECIVLKAVGKGTATATLAYSRPWAGGEKGVRKVVLTITVK